MMPRNIYYERVNGDRALADDGTYYAWDSGHWVQTHESRGVLLITLNRLMLMGQEIHTMLTLAGFKLTPWVEMNDEARNHFAQALRPALVSELGVYLDGQNLGHFGEDGAPIP